MCTLDANKWQENEEEYSWARTSRCFLDSLLSADTFTVKRSPHDTPKQTQKGGGGIAPIHSQPGTRRRWVFGTTLATSE